MLASQDRLERTVTPLSQLGTRWAAVPLAPLVVTLVAVTLVYTVNGGDDTRIFSKLPTVVYGVANVGTLVAVYLRVSDEVWEAIRAARRPSRSETVAGVLATVLGVAVGWRATTLLSDVLGVSRYTPPAFSSTPEAVSVFLVAVVVAPVAEELLFRGLLLGILLERGHTQATAGVISLLVFGLIHVFTAGVAGVINALLLGLLLTWLRLRYDSLTGAWLMHFLNNLIEFVVVVGLLPSLYI